MSFKIGLFLGLMLLLNCSLAFPQEDLINLDTFSTYAADENSSIPDDVTYIKDVNHKLDPFIGSFNDKTFTFVISKSTEPFADIIADKLKIKYKIEDSNDNIISQSMNYPDNSYDISGQ